MSTPPDLRTAEYLNSAAIHLLRGLRPVDNKAGLTAAQLSALSVLVFGGAQTLSDLARIEEVQTPTMSGIVDRLAAAGLAQRRPHPSGGRFILIAATDEGQRLMELARQARLQAIAEALTHLTPQAQQAIVAAAPYLPDLAKELGNHRLP